MMPNIICFGDSNTYGLRPDSKGRFDIGQRYPGMLSQYLPHSYNIIEEGLPGRTTIFDDPDRSALKGLETISDLIQTNQPFEWVVLMLGTNDCKRAFNADASTICSGMAQIINVINSDTPQSKILLISPIHLGSQVYQPEFDPAYDEHSIETSKQLARVYKLLAEQRQLFYLDAATVAVASPLDQQHLDAAGHAELARAVAEIIMTN